MPSPGHGSALANIPNFSAYLLPMFHVQHVQHKFQIASGFLAVQVANKVTMIALASGRLLRVDLASPQGVVTGTSKTPTQGSQLTVTPGNRN